ncbi:hypothetical protein CAY53_07855 [Desulfobulbus oralis]|uniref:Uncharacterized protein n=1 Tax=Desulfobulbus oralis TaxID=1986146 RepID=A0A2L1GNX7_9BACT|nr:hypothetical protein CAY53_07855 [Desulfobulbus oralis]
MPREAFVQAWHLGHPEKAIMAKSELLSALFDSQKANARSFRLSIRAKSARQQAACDHCTEAKQGLQRYPQIEPGSVDDGALLHIGPVGAS